MDNWSNILFYALFLSQIFLLSFYFPEKLLARMRRMLDTYPPSEYPKLYPQSVEYKKMGHTAFKVLNRIVFLLGFVILFAIARLDEGNISPGWPAFYGVIQFLPPLLLEFSEFSQFKLMRRLNSASKRRADLRRRRLFDFVSPTLLGAAVVLLAGAVFFELYVRGFALTLRTLASPIWMVVTNLVLVAIGAWYLRGRRPDPHQALGDRARQTAVQVTSLAYVSIAASVFFMTTSADSIVSLDHFEATLMSAYFQIIVFLSVGHFIRRFRLEDIDFEVYRADPAVT